MHRNKESQTKIIQNARIYTVNSTFDVVESMAMCAGRIVGIGNIATLRKSFPDAILIDMEGRCVYPGLFDAHCHLEWYARSLGEANLLGCTSETDMLHLLSQYRQQNPHLPAIIGRGWDQNLWGKKDFPDNTALNRLFPDIPVMLTRIDFHTALVNQRALDLVNFLPTTHIDGGMIAVEQGKLTGLLFDNAIVPIAAALPPLPTAERERLLLLAQQNCLEAGLTSLTNALTGSDEWACYQALEHQNKLLLRLSCMIDGMEENAKQFFFKTGIVRSEHLHVQCIKYFVDGTLGSRSAWLLQDYADAPAQRGLPIHESHFFEQQLRECFEAGFQVATHAIGDQANRFVLDHYARQLGTDNRHRRWRIEHVQVLHPDDLPRFGKHGIIPSVQPAHATSDSSWVGERLGAERLPTAYRLRDLLLQNGHLPIGSDFPIEPIQPLLGFYAAIARQNVQGLSASVFLPEQALTRREALCAMTIWAAHACFEDDLLGSLEVGKYADFVVTNKDLLTMPLLNLPKEKIAQTWIGGQVVYQSPELSGATTFS